MRRLERQRQGREREEKDTAEGVRRRWVNNLNESRKRGVDKMQRERERERETETRGGKESRKETEGEESEKVKSQQHRD